MTTTDIDVSSDIRGRVDDFDWGELTAQLDGKGHAITPELLSGGECEELAGLFDGEGFRSTIDMARHRFGDGRYRYFEHPLPDAVAALRSAFYAHLAPVANRWSELLRGERTTFPLRHEEPIERCREAGQMSPRRSSSAIARVIGTRSTRTCTATCTSRSRC